jgi:hypothetical protein
MCNQSNSELSNWKAFGLFDSGSEHQKITTHRLGMVLQLVGNYYFQSVIHRTAMAYYEAWENIDHSAAAIEKDLGFILSSLQKNSTIYHRT